MQSISIKGSTTIEGNIALASGGAIYITEFYGDLLIDISTTHIRNNQALIGGGIRIVNKYEDHFDLNFWLKIKSSIYNNIADIYGNNFTTFL